mmetsp:Transcript_25680/g.33634  ORF Transcript_25680/g.33634 Transcript_25680/m.33634 type:complete len:446 (+) Transcript_25680:121-1458(+)
MYLLKSSMLEVCYWTFFYMALGGHAFINVPATNSKPLHLKESQAMKQKCGFQCKMNLFGAVPETQITKRLYGKQMCNVISSAATRVGTALEETQRLNVCLDRSVMPPKTPVALVYAVVIAAALLATALLARIPAGIQASSELISSNASPAKGIMNYLVKPIDRLVPEFEYQFRLLVGRIQYLIDKLKSGWRSQFPPVIETLSANDWSVATLAERTRLEGPFLKHRFKLQSPREVLPLNLGQDITLCGLDSADNVCQGGLYPVSPRDDPGYFDVITTKKPSPLQEDSAFVRFIDSLAIGDEVAVKPGSRSLVYRGSFSPVTDATLIAAGPIDVIPVIQLAKELLGKDESSVQAVNVVWVNEDQEDFFLFKELEQSYFKYHPKLEVSVLLIKDVFGNDLTQNNQIQDTIPDFKIGTMAVLSGPDYFKQKMKTVLTYIGYPDDVVVNL